jgi:hypothetical protein
MKKKHRVTLIIETNDVDDSVKDITFRFTKASTHFSIGRTYAEIVSCKADALNTYCENELCESNPEKCGYYPSQCKKEKIVNMQSILDSEISSDRDKINAIEWLKDNDEDYINFGDFCRSEMGMQSQYGYYAFAGLTSYPILGKGLRTRCLRDGDYHTLRIHKDDAQEFKRRYDRYCRRDFLINERMMKCKKCHKPMVRGEWIVPDDDTHYDCDDPKMEKEREDQKKRFG